MGIALHKRESAIADLTEIVDYLAERSESAANRFIDAVEYEFSVLRDQYTRALQLASQDCVPGRSKGSRTTLSSTYRTIRKLKSFEFCTAIAMLRAS